MQAGKDPALGQPPLHPSLYHITDVSLKHQKTSFVIESDEIIVNHGLVGRGSSFLR